MSIDPLKGATTEWHLQKKIVALKEEKEELRIECNRLYGIGQELVAENKKLQKQVEELELFQETNQALLNDIF